MISNKQQEQLTLSDQDISRFAAEAQCNAHDLRLEADMPRSDIGQYVPTIYVVGPYTSRAIKRGRGTNAAGPASVRTAALAAKYGVSYE